MRSIIEWGNEQSSAPINVDDFFLKKVDQPGVYQEAEKLYKKTQKLIADGQKPEKIFPPVLEQLSPIGLSLLSYLYSEKDKIETQPIVASTLQSFEDIALLMESAPPGVAITVVFQPIDIHDIYDFLHFSSIHKSVCRFEKTNDGLRIFQLDSTNNERNLKSCQFILNNVLKSKFEFFTQKNVENPKGGVFSRQTNAYQCGVFAIKDARKMSKDTNFSQNIIPASTEYMIPPSYFKGIQSNNFFSKVLPEHGAKVVNKEGLTLQEVYNKHGIGYIEYTNKKHNQKILAFLEKHKDNPKYIKEAVEKYSTEKMTMERLIAFYSAPNGDPVKVMAFG